MRGPEGTHRGLVDPRSGPPGAAPPVPQAARIQPFGDAALLVVLGEGVTIPLARRARALAHRIIEAREGDPGWLSPVPGAASVLVPLDPLIVDPEAAAELLAELAVSVPADPPADPTSRDVVVPARYGGADGPDLEEVARELGATVDDVVERHAGTTYEVLFLGFAPGFPYLGELPASLAVPRLATPRTRVPAGSVGIAGRMTGIYPADLPGGWRIIARTELRLFDPEADPPARLRPGDRVRFEPR